MNTSFRKWVSGFVVAIGLCSTTVIGQTPAFGVFWLPEGAVLDNPMPSGGSIGTRNGWVLYPDGALSVLFMVSVSHEQLSLAITRHFKDLGWRQEPNAFLMSSEGTSFKSGWSRQCACVVLLDANGVPIPPKPYYKWRGAWRDRKGNLVNYSFGGSDDELRGYAVYYPSDLVKEIRRKWTR